MGQKVLLDLAKPLVVGLLELVVSGGSIPGCVRMLNPPLPRQRDAS